MIPKLELRDVELSILPNSTADPNFLDGSMMRKAKLPSGRVISSVFPGSVITCPVGTLTPLKVPTPVRLPPPRPLEKLKVNPFTVGASWADAGSAPSELAIIAIAKTRFLRTGRSSLRDFVMLFTGQTRSYWVEWVRGNRFFA